jgi:plasmid stabilization system protein ParE
MNWRVEFRPEVETDVADAAAWYEAHQLGLGAAFIEEVVITWRELAENPLLASRQLPGRNIRWRYLARFPYRIIYEVQESPPLVIVAAVLHAARHDRQWQERLRIDPSS